MASAAPRTHGLRLLAQLRRDGAVSVITWDADRPAVLTRLLPGGSILHKLRPEVVGTPLWHEHIQAVTQQVAALRSVLAPLERLLLAHATLGRLGVRLALALGSLGALLGALQSLLWALLAMIVGAALPALLRVGLHRLGSSIARRLLT
jgi:hypothetical protein